MNQFLKRVAHGLSIARNFRVEPLTQAELVGWNRSVYYIANELGLKGKQLEEFNKACDQRLWQSENSALTEPSEPQ